jgi:hypothetical protein
MRCSIVVTGGVHCVTGGVQVSFLGLSKRFRAVIKSLIGVIGSVGHETMLEVKRSRKCAVVEERGVRMLHVTDVGWL